MQTIAANWPGGACHTADRKGKERLDVKGYFPTALAYTILYCIRYLDVHKLRAVGAVTVEIVINVFQGGM
jgi:hypothetical protein